jgi:hypothetical protein
MTSSSSNGSSNAGNGKQMVKDQVMLQYTKDVLYNDVLTQNVEVLTGGDMMHDEITVELLLLLPQSAIRDLVVLFLTDIGMQAEDESR